jgi:hypothetical protein
MKVYIENTLIDESIRCHPYDGSTYGTAEKYYDFKKQPELIPDVLEDYKKWNERDAIQLFYDLLKWLNGKGSILESNDCAFRPPHSNSNTQYPKKLQCEGRLMIFSRKLHINTFQHSMQSLRDGIFARLDLIDPHYEWGCIAVSLAETAYLELNMPAAKQVGHEVVLNFWAWGNDETEVWMNLRSVIANMFRCLKDVTEKVKKGKIKL